MRVPDPRAKTLVKFHFTMMGVWGLLVIPTLLLWRQSILWVAFMSLYANFVGHFGAWDAARAEAANEEKSPEDDPSKGTEGEGLAAA